MAGHDKLEKSLAASNPCMKPVLRMAGLRPTRQRLALGALLFGKDHRHITAEQLYREARQAGLQVSLATVYNSLNQFTQAGMLREIALDAARSYFDTDTSNHHHYFIEDERRIEDIPVSNIEISGLPELPGHLEVRHVDVVVRVRRRMA